MSALVIPSDCPPDGTWLTNTDREYDCRWPIRYGGPKATDAHDIAALKRMGLSGVYVCKRNAVRHVAAQSNATPNKEG